MIRRARWASILLILLVSTILGCASAKYKFRPFTDAEEASLHVGLNVQSIRARFGRPYSAYPMTAGRDAGTEWDAYVLEYYAGLDPHFKKVPRPITNRLVFLVSDGDTLLSYWELEQ